MENWYLRKEEWYQNLKKVAGASEDFLRGTINFSRGVIDAIGIPKIIKNAISSLLFFKQDNQEPSD